MDYAAHYGRLMERVRARSISGYAERHHVLPRCMGGGDEPENLVLLTPEEHYVAHQLLVKIHPKNGRLVHAAMVMVANQGKRSNKSYGWLRRRLSEEMKRNNPNAGGESRRAHIARTSAAPSGWKCNLLPEVRTALSDRMRANNPMSGVRPWDHPRASEQSLQVWADALKYYEWWRENKRSYHSMAKSFGYSAPLMAHHNMYKYFKNNWIPTKDTTWLTFSNSRNPSA